MAGSRKPSGTHNPTSTRNTPPPAAPSSQPTPPRPPAGPTNDHTVSSFRHRLSQKHYPPDCPPLNVRWYYAVDVPKRNTIKTLSADNSTTGKDGKPQKQANKYKPFSAADSRAIESAFQRLSAEEDEVTDATYKRHSALELFAAAGGDIGDMGGMLSPKTKAEKVLERLEGKDEDEERYRVPVNEDRLFDVDIKKRELSPVYWLGPVYDVRRGTWFYQEGSTLKPCDENLATQVEEGYLKMKPYRNSAGAESKPSADPTPSKAEQDVIRAATRTNTNSSTSSNTPSQQQTWGLFGAHLNSFVVFVDANTAWLLTDDFYGKLSATVWQRITAGTHMGGVKLVRGYTELKSSSDSKKTEQARSATPPPGQRLDPNLEDKKAKRKSMPPPRTVEVEDEPQLPRTSLEQGRAALERKMSSYGTDADKMLESEMREDYDAEEGDDPERDIEHLILVTHGIGQRLSMRMESVNFVHDVNVLRKSLKSVYGMSPDLQVLNGEADGGKRKNCRVQCLPVCWRHLLDFPKHSLKSNGASTGFEDQYPSLEDITIEGVPSVRNLMTDLALDVLLYQSSTYREHIIATVAEECNRIYNLFQKRNPNFKGKISFIGHSLGSAIMFDILCRQPSADSAFPKDKTPSAHLDFTVESFFCLGSPVGLFQMLKGRTISARNLTPRPAATPFTEEPPSSPSSGPFPISAPKCNQLFNIFHPSDPIAYRLEPLISKSMTALKPQPLPYTKRGIFSANGQIVGGISGIGQSVTKSVSNMWTSLSSGIVSSVLNRSLGFDTSSPSASSKQTSSPATPPPEEAPYPPTALDAEIETLYSGFKKRAPDPNNPSPTAEENAKEAERIRLEELKIRALNSTGRIDFAIQEGVFDISLIASIASHLSYWGDEDVGHFVLSQMLSRGRVLRRGEEGKKKLGGTGKSVDLGSGWRIEER